MSNFNDNQGQVNSLGNLSLGQYGYDDEAGDATYGYAKDDCKIILAHPFLNTALPTTNLTEATTRTSAGIWTRTYTAGGTVASFVLLYPSQLIYRTLTGALDGAVAAQPHGFKINSVDLNYAITVADATAITVTAQTEAFQTNNAARANSSTTPLGTVTYQNPVGTTVSVLPIAQQANPYQCRAVFGTPVFVTGTSLTPLNLELGLSLPNTCVVSLTYLALNVSVALY